MRIGILGNPQSWHTKDLLRAAQSKHTVDCYSFHDLQARVSNDGETLGDFHAAQCLIVRSMPPGSLEQVVFRMDVLARLHRAGTRIVNHPKALEACVDKYLSLSLLSAAGLPVPRSFVCQTVDQAQKAFDRLERDAVIKPIFGSEGRGITRVSDPELALRAFKLLVQVGSVIYMQQYIEHQNEDLRLLVIGDEVLAMKRQNPSDWRTNAARGATCSFWHASAEEKELATGAASALGADVAGVDLVYDTLGQPLLLEVNAVPGWRALADVSQLDVAARILEHLEKLAGPEGEHFVATRSAPDYDDAPNGKGGLD